MLGRGLLALGAALSLALLPACGASETVDPIASEGSVFIKGAGATFPGPIYRQWFSRYESEHPDIKIAYNAVGSGSGERLFLEGAVDFGASDAAALTDAQVASLDRGVHFVPMTAGAIALVYNLPELDGDLRLSRAAYVDIFLGKIQRWDDERIAACNPGKTLPNRAIAVVVRSDKSGTTYAFTNHLAAVSEEWKNGPGVHKQVGWPKGMLRAPGSFGNAGLVRRTPGAISYVQYSFALKLGLRCAQLENRAGEFVAVGPESGSKTIGALPMPADLRAYAPDPDGRESYPIVTLTWIMVYGTYGDAEKRGALQKLLHWCLQDGQAMSRELGYIPLAPSVITKARAKVDAIR